MKRVRLAAESTSDTATIKREIQAVARAIVIKRDGGCILRNIRHCADPVLQGDHLLPRSNNSTYADTRLIVCVCRSCHAWKSCGSNLRKKQYDELVRTLLPADRVALWDKCERDSWRPHRKYTHDWLMELTALKQEYKALCVDMEITTLHTIGNE
ncbi:MAG: hypothetical protein MN733_32345 [Nitrososphaera sp.]|nr:hypothetical protein [Nitrososphaera sp.]